MNTDKPRYFIEAVAKTLDVLESFSDNLEELSVAEIARRTSLPYTSAFRLLYTLEQRGYVMRVHGKRRFRLTPQRKALRVGYAALGKIAFASEVTRSLHIAARRFGITLLSADNDESPSKTLSNAEQLLGEGIHVLVEFQRDDALSHMIATRCQEADVPAIAVNFPQSGAYYFGADAYRTGWLAGEYLRQYANAQWRNARKTCLVLPSRGQSPVQHTRKAGLLDGLRAKRGNGEQIVAEFAKPGMTPGDGYNLVKQFLKGLGRRPPLTLIAAFSDPLAIGAERAIRELGAEERAVIIGQGGTADVRRHIMRGGPLNASVAYFPENYGERILRLAMKLFEGEHPPLATYTDHVVLTARNMATFYPDLEQNE